MKPIYLLLLLFMAIGFFACTEDPTQVATELVPQPEGKVLDAQNFADLTGFMVEFGLFEEGNLVDLEDYGSEDLRFYLNDKGELDLDFLTKGGVSGKMTIEEALAHAPVRNWRETIELSFDEKEAPRLQEWLTQNFAGAEYLDLRISYLVNGTIVFSGLQPPAEDLIEFEAVPLI
ncbi:hypothetical protein [Neolewinella agarilytica]|uniref:Lipoprotein n=1 Tax=Neolewinella agarilytica TaxID=478744 RepID=A0A1H9B681_9BACT|nr:hypothetical protein [Neolewinella agarilytica]SEP84550.1 hypothetical protein SAMN05444359_1033 [Neolewinella agarilytica]